MTATPCVLVIISARVYDGVTLYDSTSDSVHLQSQMPNIQSLYFSISLMTCINIATKIVDESPVTEYSIKDNLNYKFRQF